MFVIEMRIFESNLCLILSEKGDYNTFHNVLDSVYRFDDVSGFYKAPMNRRMIFAEILER